jgi:hypothetical protein
MKADWLAIQSFQENQELLMTINNLSIYIKLKLAGINDERKEKVASEAKMNLASFLERFEKITQQAEQAETVPVLGIDPRLQQLVSSFLAAKQDRRRFHSDLFTKPMLNMRELLNSNDEGDQRALLECLAELRTLVEEHVHTDATQILGGI